VRSRVTPVSAVIHDRIPDPPATDDHIVAPVVDPFVPQATDDVGGRLSSTASSTPIDTLHLGPLPANAGATLDPLLLGAAQGERVRAVALGAHSSAIVANGNDTRLVEVGDRLGSAIVTSIDDAGISLSDHRRLTLAVGHVP
jgi:hypothetical protein